MGEIMKLTATELWQKMDEIGLSGWIDVSEGELLRREIEKLEPGQTYLEIGVAYGKSLATVCYYAKEGISISGIDCLNWAQRDQNMQKLGIKNISNFIEGDSQKEALVWNKPIDLLFIDGDHTYLGVLKDLASWIPYVKSGGTIIMHDYNNPAHEVKRAVDEFINGHNAYSNFEISERPCSIFKFIKK
jgi:predicted O-methyltransferase YrrM